MSDPRATGRPAVPTRLHRTAIASGVLVAAFLAFALVSTFAQRPSGPSADPLPNPMGGVARPAPGDAAGTIDVAGLRVDGARVAMGDVPLDVTVVPDWTLDNTTSQAVDVTVGQPQVREGCCPGPVYVDGEPVEPGDRVTVPAGGDVLLQFPLQMHAGMDGPHDLVVPLAVGDDTTMLEVTGDFTAGASAP